MMAFDKYFYKMIQELNQSTVNSALMKHQSIKDKNPISKNRSEKFSKRAKNQGKKRGTLIRTITNPESRRTADNYYIESATQENNYTVIRMKALMVDPYEDSKSKTELVYDVKNNTLYTDILARSMNAESGIEEITDYSRLTRLWLLSRTDAQNLWKTIKKYTGINVSWKSMDFVTDQ
jgi:hypothetical protein